MHFIGSINGKAAAINGKLDQFRIDWLAAMAAYSGFFDNDRVPLYAPLLNTSRNDFTIG